MYTHIYKYILYILHYRYNTYIYICMCLVGQSMDCSPPGSSVHGILQGRILEWAAMSFSRGSSPPRDRTRVSCVSCTGRQVLDHCAPGKPCPLYGTEHLPSDSRLLTSCVCCAQPPQPVQQTLKCSAFKHDFSALLICLQHLTAWSLPPF